MMEQIRNKNGRQCSEECPHLDEHRGIINGVYECKLHTRVFRVRLGTVFGGPGDECPFAVLREVLGVKEPTPKVEPFDRLEQCNGCRWSSIRKCAPPLNGGPCLDREVDNPPRPVRADLTLTALRLDALRFEGALRMASNNICEILSDPTAEARTCSGDLFNCTCMQCKLMRLRDWILRRAKETMP